MSSRRASSSQVSSPKRARSVAYRSCPHIGLPSVPFITNYRRSLVAAGARQCGQCGQVDDGTSLYSCLGCGYLGCMDADRPHLPHHFSTASDQHCVAVDPHTGILYCWLCQQFIWNHFLEYLCTFLHDLDPGHEFEETARKMIDFTTDAGLRRHCVSMRGLYNLGKTCFMNCVLQVLLHNPHLFRFFLAVGHDVMVCRASRDTILPNPKSKQKKRDGSSEICIACEVDTLFVEMYSGSIQPHAPTSLLQSLWTSFSHLAGYEQQDAHEFLVALLFRLHEHLGGRPFGCDCIIHRTFSGVLQSSVTCLGCGTCSPVFDPFMDISLDVLPRYSSDQLSLLLCLDRFCAVEVLPGGSYVCAACNSTYKEAHKQLSIRRPPNTLCFQLKRFGQSSTSGTPLINNQSSQTSASAKLHHRVAFPEAFSIYPYLSSNVAADQSVAAAAASPYSSQYMYKLAAVIHHIGDLDSSGHYICYLHHRNCWFKCDDAMISIVPASEVYGCNAYMLFYNRLQ